MKQKYIIFGILLAFIACTKENLVVDTPSSQGDETEIEVNITIARADDFASTKATVKNAFADNDVVFVFFKGIAATKYLEMKYNSSTDTWTSTAKNGLTSSDISDAADKKMTAIYLPYGSTATVGASEGNFVFSDISYSGYFLKAELATYTYEGDILSGTLNMTAPELSSDSDKLIHFDISGFTSGHDYKLYQDYVKPLTFASVSSSGVISTNEGVMGTAITGYEDGSMMSFSGILDASAIGNAVDYQFSIDDLTSSTLYTRDAGIKTLSTSKYIGIGAINNAEVWNAIEYVDLGLSVRWAKCNIGASLPEQSGSYFSWGEVETKYDYSWSTYKWCNGASDSQTKYNNNNEYGTVDNKTTLDPEDDVAHVMWEGNWRMPTMTEMYDLLDNCRWEWTTRNEVYGYLVTSNMIGYTERSIFFPVTGSIYNTEISPSISNTGWYWASSLDTTFPDSGSGIMFTSSKARWTAHNRCSGCPVRPVCP